MLEPSSVEVVLYHANCNDGFGAAYSAWKLLGNRAEYIACSHGTPPPDITGKKVVCLDFSYDNATTKKLIKETVSINAPSDIEFMLESNTWDVFIVNSTLYKLLIDNQEKDFQQLLIKYEQINSKYIVDSLVS